MSQSSQSSEEALRSAAEDSSDDDDELVSAVIGAQSGGATAKRGAEEDDADEAGEANELPAKRARKASKAAIIAEANRAAAELKRDEDKQEQLIRARRRVNEQSLPTPAVSATHILKANPERAGLIARAHELKKMSMKDLEKAQQEEAVRMREAGASALSDDRRRVLKAAEMSEIPALPPFFNVFPRPPAGAVTTGPPTPPRKAAKGRSRAKKEAASGGGGEVPEELTELLEDAHERLLSDLSDDAAAAFLRSGVVEAVGARVALPTTVADWLFAVAAVHPDPAAVRACGSAIHRCFLSREGCGGWAVTTASVVSALCDLGATEALLGVGDDADADAAGDAAGAGAAAATAAAVARDSDFVAPPGTEAVRLHNLQMITEVTERAARAGAVGEGDAAALMTVMFRLAADSRTAPVGFNMERVVTELLELPSEDAWPGVRDGLAGAALTAAGHHHRLVRVCGLLAPMSARGRELRSAVVRRFAVGVVKELDAGADVSDDGGTLDDVGFSARVLSRLARQVAPVCKTDGGLYRLFCLYQLLDATVPLEPRDPEACARVGQLIKAVTAHKEQVSSAGEYDLGRDDCRTVVNYLSSTMRKYGRLVEYSAPSGCNKQSQLTGVVKTGGAAGAAKATR